jgi:hypothetical protein
MKKHGIILIVVLRFLFLPCILAPADSADDIAPARNLDAGYFLLHSLLDNEASLPLLLDIKHAPKDIQDYAVRISKTAKDGLAVMQKMRDANPSVNWDKNPLPKMEQDVRASITAEKEHQLLFGTSNGDFVRALLVSQAEASKYAANIAKVLASQEMDPDHRRDFSRISAQWQALYETDFQLLRKY